MLGKVMENVWLGLTGSLGLLTDSQGDVYKITFLSLKVSGIATLLSVILGMPLGIWLAFKEFPGKKIANSMVNFGMGLPPVVVGLVVSLALWRYGPLGELGLMYTVWAMIIAQAIIASPIVAALSCSAIVGLPPNLKPQLLSLGATRYQAAWLLIKEARFGLMAAVIAGFGRVISEVGASLMVGGNVKGETRVLTTATVMEVGKGNYDIAISLSLILLFVAYSIVMALTYLQHSGKER